MSGKLKKAGIWCLMGALVLAAVGGIASATWMHRQLKGCETLLDKAVGIISANNAENAKNKRALKEEEAKGIYTAKEGDDIVTVAIGHGVSPSQLMDANNLHVGDSIKPGDKLIIPGRTRGDSPRTIRGDSPHTANGDSPRLANGDSPQTASETHGDSPRLANGDSPRTANGDSPQRGEGDCPPGEKIVKIEHIGIVEVKYPGDDEITIAFDRIPDASVLREYISVEPVKGGVTFEYDYDYDYDADEHYRRRPRVKLRGDFAFRTNLTLRVRAGLPAANKIEKPNDPKEAEIKVEPLERDFVQTLQRKDAPPRVRFVDSGRYLPPGGARMLAVDSVNVAKIHCAAAAVPTANIVQLLARENDKYKGVYIRGDGDGAADSEATESIADNLMEWDVETLGRVNEHGVTPFALRTLPDAASNGVFIVAVRSADKDRKDERWWWDDRRGEKWNPNRYKLVCITDIGITVRREGERIIAWTTSLTTGAPVTNCVIDVYGSNNRHLAKGHTDSKGLCDIVCSTRAEPFAVIAKTADGKDTSFVCLENRQNIEEKLGEGEREEYLRANGVTAFVWTERGIYRHNEQIFVHAILRNGANEAPKPFPVEFLLRDPNGEVVQRKTVVSDAYGAAWCDSFAVPAELPSGRWQINVAAPGNSKNTRIYGSRAVSVEEFAPPQIRVSVEPEGDSTTNFSFAVKAEHLYGGPARGLTSAGAVVFMDYPFRPKGWEAWHFGNEDLGLKPSYRRLWKFPLNDEGSAVYKAPLLEESGKPKAAVLAIGEGTVFEEGGRPARARGKQVLHYYPFYIGATLGGNVRIPDKGFAKTKVACVRPDGTRLPEARKLKVSFDRVESVYSCKEDSRGWSTWHCERVRMPQKSPVAEIETKANGDVELEIPFRLDGDYALTITDIASGTSFGCSFWLGSRGDDSVRAPLSNPSKVTLTLDKKVYRPGEVPRLLVKSPFAGWALLTTMRDKVVSRRVLKLDGATQEITLDKVDGSWAPNLDVAISVVQSAENGGRHQTARAHGYTALAVRRWENEFPVAVKTSYKVGEGGGGTLTADVTAVGQAATGTVAVVTVVDEGIHLLTGWNALKPVDYFARLRTAGLPLYDLFDNLLPVWDGDPTKARGFKTGGDMGVEMLGRVSPVPTRRFRTIAFWQTAVPLTNGVGHAVFELPEFVGEVRVAAVALSAKATGAGDVRQKVTPKLVMQSDAPRFAAPGDSFDVTVTLANRSGAAGEAKWSVEASAGVACEGAKEGAEKLADGASVTRTVRARADGAPGEAKIVFRSEGCGEKHEQTILLPVRPAVASRERSGTILLNPGEAKSFPVDNAGSVPEAAVRQFTPGASALSQLVGALEFLAEYPHGCLEQTSSRIFPLVAAGGFLNRIAVDGKNGKLAKRGDYVAAGVKRVASMIREKDFVMWPDCNYAPWDREVSLYAAHFLVEAEKSGAMLAPAAKKRVMEFLKKWSLEKSRSVSAYACHTLALAGEPAQDRMLVLYDDRRNLAAIDRARLARAFVLSGDRERAVELLRTGAMQPGSVKEAAFAMLALLEVDPEDARLAPLVKYLESTRVPDRFSWGTTGENAHALVALGAYYRHHPVKDGTPKLVMKGADGEKALAVGRRETVRGAGDVKVMNHGDGSAWLTWRTIGLPDPVTVTNESCQIQISRRFLTPEGLPASMAKLVRGDLLLAEITLTAPVARTFNDLVVQDLFPAAFEPVHGGVDPSLYKWAENYDDEWVMRSDARDDRMLVFSKKFYLAAGKSVRFLYPLRVVTAGDFVMPGPTVEAMYAPDIRASAAPTRIKVGR